MPRLLIDIIPESWNARSDATGLWITCFQVVFGDVAALGEERAVSVELDGALVVISEGEPNYYYAPELEVVGSTPDRGLVMAPLEPEFRTLPKGIYLKIILPFASSSGPGDPVAVRQRVEEISGLISVQLGRSAIFRKRYENVVFLAAGQVSSSSPAFKSPDGRMPTIDVASLDELRNADAALGRLADSERRRAGLGLRWYDESHSKEDIDALLSIWLALETIGMQTTNVRDLHDALALVYRYDRASAESEFQLGKIQGLRSRIVHNGLRPPVHADLMAFLQAVFVDVFRQMIGGEPWNLARQSLIDCTEEPAKWFPGYRPPVSGGTA